MNKMIRIFQDLLVFVAITCLTYASFLFMKFNAPIIKHDVVLYVTLGLNLIGFVVAAFLKKELTGKTIRWLNLFSAILVSIFIVYSVVTTVLVNYFQPLALYDQVIYAAIAGFVLLMIVIVIQSIEALIKNKVYVRHMVTSILLALFVMQFYALNTLQQDFDFTNIEGKPFHIFESSEGGYEIFRIPTLLVLSKGSTLKNGTILEEDQIIVMAEARRNGSLDDGDIDLVQKISSDGGKTWSNLIVTRTYKNGVGKVGNSTPVFNKNTGEIILLHLSGNHPKEYKTYQMISVDGGYTCSTPTFVYDGLVGPGHGIMIDDGLYAGRMVAPAYHDGSSLSIYSDDNGRTWHTSEKLTDGNESEIAQINDNGDLMMVVRTNKPVSLPHDPLQKLYVTSTDGGATWSDLKVLNDIKEPICMSSIVSSDKALYYSHPNV